MPVSKYKATVAIDVPPKVAVRIILLVRVILWVRDRRKIQRSEITMNPIAPKMLSAEMIALTQMSERNDSKLFGKILKPAVQKAETEWKIAGHKGDSTPAREKAK